MFRFFCKLFETANNENKNCGFYSKHFTICNLFYRRYSEYGERNCWTWYVMKQKGTCQHVTFITKPALCLRGELWPTPSYTAVVCVSAVSCFKLIILHVLLWIYLNYKLINSGISTIIFISTLRFIHKNWNKVQS